MKFSPNLKSVEPSREPSTRDPAASMSLINNIIRHPLDPAYEDEAAKRAAAGKSQSSGTRSPLLILAMLLIGFGLATSAMTLRVPIGVAEKQHKQLVSRIDSGQKRIDARSASVKSLNAQIAGLQTSALARGNRSNVADQLRTAEAVTGAAAVKGPGLLLTVNDAPGAGTDAQGDPRTSGSDSGRVTSADLQVVVNGLWQAGAEAISINGQRVTSLTAIRFAGEAILVNFRPLVPPYAISAIGPDTLQREFSANSGGSYLAGLVKGFQIRSSFEQKKSLAVPAAPSASLNYARPLKEQQ